MVPRLEPVAALGELVHLPQQVDGALEELGKIHDFVLRERPPMLGQRHREDAGDAAGQQHVEVPRPRREGVPHRRRRRLERGAVTLPRAFRDCVRLANLRGGARARLAVLRQEVEAQRFGDGPQRLRRGDTVLVERPQVGGDEREARIRDRPIGEERGRPPGTDCTARRSRSAARTAHDLDVEVRRRRARR